jgi:hypothetical protein
MARYRKALPFLSAVFLADLSAVFLAEGRESGNAII